MTVLSSPFAPPHRLVLGLGTALALVGCASPPTPEAQQQQVLQLAREHHLALASLPTASTAPMQQRRDELLAQPLSWDAAVQLALLNNPGLQAQWAVLQISAADRLQASRLPNPHFSFARMLEGEAMTLERTLRFDVLGLITLPWRLRGQEQQQALAQLQAAQEVVRLAADTRKAWVQAVAAQQVLEHTRRAQQATAAATELAKRMTQVGNWSTAQQLREQLSHAEASAQVTRAELALHSAREQLARLLGIDSGQLRLPPHLPALPKELPERGDIEATALRERLDVRAAVDASRATADSLGLNRITGWLGDTSLTLKHESHFAPGERSNARGWELELPLPLFDWHQARDARAQAIYLHSAAQAQTVAQLARSEARLAWQQWRAAHQLARQAQDEIVPLRQRLAEETLLRYNGMLLSVWDVLTETRNQSLAVRSAIEAQRDFWLADTDLHTALSGTSPGALSALSTSPGPSAANDTQGH